MLRVTWRQLPGLVGSLHGPDIGVGVARSMTRSVLEGIPTTIGPAAVFKTPVPRLRAGVRSLGHADIERVGDLAAYYQVFVSDRATAEQVKDRLTASLDVDPREVWIEAAPVTGVPESTPFRNAHVVQAPTRDLRPDQGYLRPRASFGVDADFAHGVPGGDGDGIYLIDIEYGWNTAHEDLPRRSTPQQFGQIANEDHGTAVLGVVGGDWGGQPVGVRGIASGCWVEGYSATETSGAFNPEGAVESASAWLALNNQVGVILIELQTAPPLRPLEVSSLFWKVVLQATGKGIYVVAAAGNGGLSLDPDGLHLPGNDSGAILVGAGGSLHGHSLERVAASNWGERVDVQGWGEHVVTCGGLSDPAWCDLLQDRDGSRCYTQSFAQTSSAAAIVAGVVACVAGAVKAAGRPALSPTAMRDLLRTTGQPQLDPGDERKRVGPLPDLKAALVALGLA